jgi:hypothetical protein
LRTWAASWASASDRRIAASSASSGFPVDHHQHRIAQLRKGRVKGLFVLAPWHRGRNERRGVRAHVETGGHHRQRGEREQQRKPEDPARRASGQRDQPRHQMKPGKAGCR